MASNSVDACVSQTSTKCTTFTYDPLTILCMIYTHTNIVVNKATTTQALKTRLQALNMTPLIITVDEDKYINSTTVQYEQLEKYCGRIHSIKADQPLNIQTFIAACVYVGHIKHHDCIIFDLSHLSDKEKNVWTETIYNAINKSFGGVFRTIYILS